MKQAWIHNSRASRCLVISGIVAVKLILMGLFSSDYQDEMFVPFVRCFLEGNNPYSFYFENQLLPSFPYFPLMLLIESAGGLLLRWLAPSTIFFRNLLFKLPLLVFDLAGYCFIRKMHVRFKYAVVFYFCSPIILYGTYMHGQLDLIPTVLLLIAVYHVVNWKGQHNLLWYSLFLGFAINTKFHIIAAVPILFFYVMKKQDFVQALKCLGMTAATVALFTFGFWGQGFAENVLFNKEQSVLLSVNLDYGTTQVVIPVLVLTILYLKVFELNYFNKNLLISMLGLLFAVFLICIPPMPAWFTWVVPFVALYFGFVDDDKYKIMLAYAGYNLLYLFYFIFLHQTSYTDLYFLGKSLQGLKIMDSSLKNVVFTLMIAFFSVVIYKIYHFGIASNSLYKRSGIPFTIGIAGDSGAGKSKLLEKIERLFGTGRDVLFIEGDGDHRWARNDENWEKYTALNPQANYLYRQAEDIRVLRSGNHVNRSEYDHNLGVFTAKKKVSPKKYIILCGLHSLYLPQLRRELDLKIYMDTDAELRKFWKIQRDTTQRGYSKERIVAQIEKRLPDAEKYIYPQKDYADLIITYFDKTLSSCFEEQHEVSLSVKLTLDININVEGIISSFRKYGVTAQMRVCDDLLHQEIIFDGAELHGPIDFEHIAEINIPQYEDVFTYSPQWGTDVEGIIQLFLLILISEKMRG